MQDQSVSFVTRSIDMMLAVLYMRMRGTSMNAIRRTVDLSVESECRNI